MHHFKNKEYLQGNITITDTLIQHEKTYDSYEIPYQELQEAVIVPSTVMPLELP